MNTFKLIISYNDPSGEEIVQEKEYTINGTEPMPTDDFGNGSDMDMDNTSSPLSTKAKIGMGVGAVVGIIAVVVIVKIVKKRKADKFIEEDDSEGTDDNEQL